VHGPYVSAVTETEATIRWDSEVEGCTEAVALLPDGDRAFSGTAERFVLTTDYGSSIGLEQPDQPGPIFMHTVRLTGLPKSTCLPYTITTEKEVSVHRLCTARGENETIRITAIGDTNPTLGYTALLLNQMSGVKPDFVLHLGDMQYYSSVAESWQAWTRLMQPLFNIGAVYPTRGNHEKEKEAPAEYDDYYSRLFHAPGTDGETRWYTFSSAGVHFFSLSTEDEIAVGTPQYTWLTGALKAAKSSPGFRFSLVFFHRPIYSLGDVADEAAIRSTLEPLFSENGVKVVLSGHMHGYERFDINGTLALVSGGGGGIIGDVNAHLVDRPELAAKRQKAAAAYNFLDLVIEPGLIRGQALGTDGRPIDSFEWSVP
jgi:predicted phosphodiesterase